MTTDAPDKKNLSIAEQMADAFTMEQARLCDAYADDINGAAMCMALKFLSAEFSERYVVDDQYDLPSGNEFLTDIIEEHEEQFAERKERCPNKQS